MSYNGMNGTIVLNTGNEDLALGRAPSDLSTPYRIARLVDKPVTAAATTCPHCGAVFGPQPEPSNNNERTEP